MRVDLVVDYELTESLMRTVVPDVVWTVRELSFIVFLLFFFSFAWLFIIMVMQERAYISDYARYEHSHYYDLFNAPPPGVPRRPLGYYVARCVATGAYADGGCMISFFV